MVAPELATGPGLSEAIKQNIPNGLWVVDEQTGYATKIYWTNGNKPLEVVIVGADNKLHPIDLTTAMTYRERLLNLTPSELVLFPPVPSLA